jgi:predicted acylesterase/phospholipase RssA
MKIYDTVVFSGGSIKGLAFVGALHFLLTNEYLSYVNIEYLLGTSSGAITAYLISIGFTPIEIMVYLCKNQILEDIFLNMVSFASGDGALKFDLILNVIERMTIEKLGFLVTFRQIKEIFNKTLIFSTFNITKDKLEYISHKNYPDMPCLIGLRMSCNIPLVFEKFKYNNCYYVDGGLLDNFPIDALEDSINHNILGLYIEHNLNEFNIENTNMFTLLTHVIFIPIRKIMESTITKYKDQDIVPISFKDSGFFSTSFNTIEKFNIFSVGYKYAAKYFNKKIDIIDIENVDKDNIKDLLKTQFYQIRHLFKLKQD